MPLLSELSTLVKRRRLEMGLSQERLASLVGLSRATINQLETGKIADLSVTRAEAVANQVGLGLGVTGTRRSSDSPGAGLEAAARTASVSYSQSLPASVLRTSLVNGTVAPDYLPQLRTLLDEAPVGVLSAAASDIHALEGIAPQATWQKMRALAASLGCRRGIWT
jgi:transcriptional regulator with XRE-family HTH domain